MHADKTNRTVLLLVGLMAAAIGIFALLASFGFFGSSWQHRSLLENRVTGYFGEQSGWLWPMIAVGAGLITLACLYWLYVLLFSTDRAGDLRMTGDKFAGRTTLATNALTDALSDEIASYHGVARSNARVLGDSTSPQLAINATLQEGADLAALRRRIEREAVSHARQALARPELPVQLDLTVTSRRAPRTL
jgi:hypothetical protein